MRSWHHTCKQNIEGFAFSTVRQVGCNTTSHHCTCKRCTHNALQNTVVDWLEGCDWLWRCSHLCRLSTQRTEPNAVVYRSSISLLHVQPYEVWPYTQDMSSVKLYLVSLARPAIWNLFFATSKGCVVSFAKVPAHKPHMNLSKLLCPSVSCSSLPCMHTSQQ